MPSKSLPNDVYFSSIDRAMASAISSSSVLASPEEGVELGGAVGFGAGAGGVGRGWGGGAKLDEGGALPPNEEGGGGAMPPPNPPPPGGDTPPPPPMSCAIMFGSMPPIIPPIPPPLPCDICIAICIAWHYVGKGHE